MFRLSLVLVALCLSGTLSAEPLTVQGDKDGKFQDQLWMSPTDMKVGDRGRIEWNIQVEEIIDDTNMIVYCIKFAQPQISVDAFGVQSVRPTFISGGTGRQSQVKPPIKVWMTIKANPKIAVKPNKSGTRHPGLPLFGTRP